MPEAVRYGNAGCVVHGPPGGPDEGDRPVFGAVGGPTAPRGEVYAGPPDGIADSRRLWPGGR
ncbi:hypothetical protein GA0115243_1037133 [Streptomyces sp. ScaeMP-e83]|nr:hypothetical protein GA0115243_1037133 [Streptomyces sp. ScaeMP-e83]